ncbi:MAG TPA: hypothetical protein VLA56_13300 [Pseudomonadales bacterium]|nr:hypothetical protein [Pseudomonadales bacterium]
MSRIRLFTDEELAPAQREQAQALEAKGGDASVLRAIANRQDMFDDYFRFYYPAHQGGTVEMELKELMRLKIARLNDCFT